MKKDYLSRRKIGSIIFLDEESKDLKSWRECQQFRRYLFEYFEELTSGQCGWGISFINWLEVIKGWKHHGLNYYKPGKILDKYVKVANAAE